MYQFRKPSETEVETYRLVSKMPQHKRRVKQAEEIIRKVLDGSNHPALSFSGGKDSVVLLDLAVRSGFRGKIVFFKYGIVTDVETPAENFEILDYYAKAHGLDYCVLNCLGEADCWERCGRFILEPETEEERRIFKETNYDYANKSIEWEKLEGIDLNFIGMRKSESNTRCMMLSQKGAVYQTKSRPSITCCPLLNFSNADIWAYIFSHELPYLRIYDYPYISRERIRNEITLLYNNAIMRNGMVLHYKQMYPDFFLWVSERWGGTGINEL